MLYYSPARPQDYDWSQLYPELCGKDDNGSPQKRVEFADVGCGYGGLLGFY